jgi:hypothetical protein
MEKRTSVIGLPVHPRLVEKAAQILGECGLSGLVFGNIERLGTNLLGNKIDLGGNRHIMYGMSDFEDEINHPDVRLAVSEGVKDSPGFTFIAVVCIAADDSWKLFARIVDGERSEPVKELILRLGVRNMPIEGVSVDADQGKAYVRILAAWAAKQLAAGHPKARST